MRHRPYSQAWHRCLTYVRGGGFAERIVTDQETLAGTATFYDNVTVQQLGDVEIFPFAAHPAREWRWVPGLPDQPNPAQIELSFTDVTLTFVPTSDGATYFTLPTERRVRLEEGTFPNGAAATVEVYARQIEASDTATMLRDAASIVSKFDDFGNVLVEDVSTAGVDLTLHVERTFKNDTDAWILGQLQTQTECSAASKLSQCRTLTRHTTAFGETHDKSTSTDDGSPDTQLTIRYERDAFGNILRTIADDAFGHHRVSEATYDGEGVYPTTSVNAAKQTTRTTFDARFGTLSTLTDPNHLVTTRAYDGFGRLGLTTHPDGIQRMIARSRTRDGGPGHDAWRVTERTTVTGGADDTVEYDCLGRAIRWWWHGPEPTARARIMQRVTYDALGEHVARRSVPVSEDTPESQLLDHVFEHDAMGREVRHTMPWKAVVQTAYDGLLVHVTDALMNTTTTAQDALGRAVSVTDATLAVTAYTYGPFGSLYTVTAPGNALTRAVRDAFGRVRKMDDPNRGVTTSTYDGFGELLSSTDALGRTVTWSYDVLGRTETRLDQHGAESLATTWTWDTALHGVGKLAAVASPDGTKTYAYNSKGQLHDFTLAVQGESDALTATLGYDTQGRVATITYPTPTGATPFVVAQDHDAFGHVVTVRDSTTGLAYWRLTDVDGAGRYRRETFGKEASSVRGYFPDKESLQSIVTQSGGATVQDLAYDYDARHDLTSRTDMLQAKDPTERFRYDAQKRLTCAYFSTVENDAAPCALAYGYHPSGNGNLIEKSDAGTLAYGDLEHPHAVTGVGSQAYAYDAVGNQTTRPGATLTYTPFDLPRTITQATGTVKLDYDGDEQRIRKTSPDAETLYFADLYERVTTAAPAGVAHRYHIRSPERVVAVVTRGGPDAGTVYVHVDHLGSVDVLTDANGAVVERRSYDPFGRRRNPVWGQPVPASFASMTTVGFTGQEDDGDLGLVNMKGRLYDPRIGRFLTTDPIVSRPLSGQSWNPYTYVLNNPLNYVDPSGFQEAPSESQESAPMVPGQPTLYVCVGRCDDTPKPPPDVSQSMAAGAARPPTDTGTLGTGSAQGQQQTSEPSPASIVGQVGVGVLAGAVAWFGEGTKMIYLNLFTLGGYGGYRLWSGIYQAYREQGNSLLGALNGLNPLYQIGKGAADTVTAVERGDYMGAGAAGITTAGVLGMTVAGGGVGGGGAIGKTGAVPQLGGAYSQVRAAATQAELGGQVHHAPSWAATRAGGAPGVTRWNAPSIWMETADHEQTASHGRLGTQGAAYRAEQATLIREGRYLDALKLDVDTVRSLFGDKYDGAIQQMGEYVWRANQ